METAGARNRFGSDSLSLDMQSDQKGRLMSGSWRSTVALLLVSVLLSMTVPGQVIAVSALAAPTTLLSLDPPSPSGLNGWWLSPPDVFATVNQDSVVHYAWSGGAETTIAVAAAVPQHLGVAPEGVGILSAYSVNSSGETETPPVSVITASDSNPPSQPTDLSADVDPGPVIELTWSPSTDAVSGVTGYTVYRNLTGPPFSLGDAVGTVAGTAYSDSDVPPVALVYYAVGAWDQAGHHSLLSTALMVTADLIPPSTPGDLQAWLNGFDWCRVSWTASADAGSGLLGYTVERSLDGAPFEIVAQVGSTTLLFDDTDPDVAMAGTVDYRVTAYDRANNPSLPAGPVRMGTDDIAPTTPVLTAVSPLKPVDGFGFISVAWTPGADTGSGVLRSEVLYGPDENPPAFSASSDSDSLLLPFADDAIAWWVSVRSEDRAGNLSMRSPSVGVRDVPVYRLAGADRVETSRLVASSAFSSASTAVFASSQRFADALCASALAGVLRGPIILLGPGPVPAQTQVLLGELGITDGYIIGGSASVSGVTQASLDSMLSGELTRLSGVTRYDTAAIVAGEVADLAGTPDRVFVVSGEKFPDALSAGAPAYAGTSPILFARAEEIPLSTSDAIASLGTTHSVIVGGSGAVTPLAETLLPGVERIAGTNRYATSRLLGEWGITEGILEMKTPVVVTGTTFPDGLSAAALAGESRSPIVLTSDSSAEDVGEWLQTNRTTLQRIWVAGGTNAVSAATEDTIWSLISVF